MVTQTKKTTSRATYRRRLGRILFDVSTHIALKHRPTHTQMIPWTKVSKPHVAMYTETAEILESLILSWVVTGLEAIPTPSILEHSSQYRAGWDAAMETAIDAIQGRIVPTPFDHEKGA